MKRGKWFYLTYNEKLFNFSVNGRGGQNIYTIIRNTESVSQQSNELIPSLRQILRDLIYTERRDDEGW